MYSDLCIFKSMKVKILDSWNLKDFGLLVELILHAPGLPAGTKLISLSGTAWVVKARVLYENALDLHKRFDGEHEIFSFRTGGRDAVLKSEDKFVFYYLFDSKEDAGKPLPGETLEVATG